MDCELPFHPRYKIKDSIASSIKKAEHNGVKPWFITTSSPEG